MARVPENGLTVVVNPENPRIDIVFVHGFNGHPQNTWSTSPKKSAKRSQIFWPRDLVPETIPDARVLTYGYGVRIRFRQSQNSSKSHTYDFAKNFLVALEAERRQDPKRPLVFVTHSYGGLVVKEAVRQAERFGKEEHPHLYNVYKATAGFIFFGTPHAGVDNRWRKSMKLIALPLASYNKNVATALHPASERLKELQDEFGPMARKNGWAIHSFLENSPIHVLGKVVEDTSSCVGDASIEIAEHILQDHRGMCRFASTTDPEYKKVSRALDRIVSNALRNPTSTTVREQSLTEEEQISMKGLLYFPELGYRESTIAAAQKQTCTWFLHTSEFIDWGDPEKMEQHHGFLWIKGKPGAGKSTLLNFLLEKERESKSGWTPIHFFFHSRGTLMEKCIVGMYRSLLFQLFEAHPRLLDTIKTPTVLRSYLLPETDIIWHVEELKSIFRQAILHAGQDAIVCYIDALDECDEDDIRDTLEFWEQLSKTAMEANIRLRFCASRRHYPEITIASGLSVILDNQSGHDTDIVLYINSQLKLGNTRETDQIKTAIQNKASGVFLWVVLVVRMLNKEYDRGHTQLLKKLDRIPASLHQLFRDLLTRNDNPGDCDEDNSTSRKESFVCLQHMLFRYPDCIMTSHKLYRKIHRELHPGQADPVGKMTDDHIRRFLLNCSKGLVEVAWPVGYRVEFIHESVRDFLLRENGLRDAFPEYTTPQNHTSLEGLSHEELKQHCLRYIGLSTFLPAIRMDIEEILYHAEKAQKHGIDQTGFLETLDMREWKDCLGDVQCGAESLCNEGFTLQVLAAFDCAHLIEVSKAKTQGFKPAKKSYGAPIFISIRKDSKKATLSLLKAQADMQPETSSLRTLYKEFDHSMSRSLIVYSSDCHLFSTVNVGDFVLASYIVASGYYDVDELTTLDLKGCKKVCTPLWCAARHGNIDMAEILLANGADPNGKGGIFPLFTAIALEDVAIVRLLLRHGAKCGNMANSELALETSTWASDLAQAIMDDDAHIDMDELYLLLLEIIEAKSSRLLDVFLSHRRYTASMATRFCALHLAISAQNMEALCTLLDHGCGIDDMGNEDMSPLNYACACGYTDYARALLDRGANMEAKGSTGKTSLMYGCIQMSEFQPHFSFAHGKIDSGDGTVVDYVGTIRLLLERGADVNAKDDDGVTALMHVCRWGDKASVRDLLENGADIHERANNGKTLLSFVYNGDKEITQLLVEKCAGVEGMEACELCRLFNESQCSDKEADEDTDESTGGDTEDADSNTE